MDQLYVIQRLLGPITRKQTAMFLANRRFSGFRFGDELTSHPETLAARYRSRLEDGTLPPEGLDFLQRCLRCALRLSTAAQRQPCLSSGPTTDLSLVARRKRGCTRQWY